ncbi:DWNN domain-containing protein [Microdochium trichocladiopsis]|uniref:DWNN domain-containing protein n=1 Tax=Microdochium trichocladiopsis TaxID=1682393 RepID=A0A9P9BMF8_9PEZI|nr:DWNN domain-containing protein [Microdochium trichocladiopsis]KAH7026233.1 DWNN domain-containing protein [Microdochium trichocladiopsis]
MTSSVFYKFKSQKEPTRIEFDGTGISVFELKRDIIIKSGLGNGTDFDLAIYTEDNSEEYDDDTTVIPRSTTVIARRLPPIKPGAGRAARYVTGKMPASAKNSARKEATAKPVKPATTGLSQMSAAMTEEEKMMAMFQAQSDQWNAQQEEMSHQQAVYKPGAKKPANVPDHEPPNGYICYRCGQKGHWIQVCPTNDNPEYDNRPRVKRTTGIPRSFLKTVDKAALQQTGADGEEIKPPSGVMVNADGDFVIAEPDKASWEQFQAKTKSSAAAAKAATEGDKELEERGLLCSIDKRMFVDPMKTPCCGKTYCSECITNALTYSDLVCPACQTDGVLFDDLKPDDEAVTKIKEYLAEKEAAKTKERSKSPAEAVAPKSPAADAVDDKSATDSEVKKEDSSAVTAAEESTQATTKSEPDATPSLNAIKSPSPEAVRKGSVASTTTTATKTQGEREGSASTSQNGEQQSKKRPAEDVLENPKIPKGPKAMQQQQQNQMPSMPGMPGMMPGMPGMPGMPNMMFPMGGMNGFGPGGMPGMMGMNGMDMSMMMGMNGPGGGMGGMNPMMMNGMFNNQGGNGGFQNGMMNGGGRGGYNNFGGGGMNGMRGGYNNNNNNHHHQNGGFYNQQYNNGAGYGMNNNFGNQAGGVGDDGAYFRQPVNPGRHQSRQRRVRPSDYKQL